MHPTFFAFFFFMIKSGEKNTTRLLFQFFFLPSRAVFLSFCFNKPHIFSSSSILFVSKFQKKNVLEITS